MNPTTTLAKIRACHPCSEGWNKLLVGLGYTDGNYDPERVVSLGDIATTNGVQDALWAIRALDWSDISVRRTVIAGTVLLAIKRALKYTTDNRVHETVADLARWCAGDDSVDLKAVRRKAAAATTAAAYAAAATAAAATAAATAEREHQLIDILANFARVALAAVKE